jgi:hypothetical protein
MPHTLTSKRILVGAEAMNAEFSTEYYFVLRRRRKFEIDRLSVFP